MKTQCPECKSHLVPIGDGTNCMCASAADGKCSYTLAIPSPGEQELVDAYQKKLDAIGVVLQ